jgi:phosphoribosyl-AMP cyclohydrolase / phosphoribosyl-ATP pyrophosphohydrolase
MGWIDEIRFDERGLVPVVAQDARTAEVLMLAWASRDALRLTHETGRAHYWSRSRGELWAKGETSGHQQRVVEVRVDCDADAVLYRVQQTGPACHTGERSCFHRAAADEGLVAAPDAAPILARVQSVLARRWAERPAGSYTTYLFERGPDKILKKVGEEAAETIIAAKNGAPDELAAETADLLFHLMALWQSLDLPFDAVYAELERRFGASPREGSTTDRARPAE